MIKRILNYRNLVFVFFAVLILVSRIIAITSIKPGNAPDEGAHLYIVNNLVHGHFISVEDEIKNSNYPYSLYNPLPYLPSVISLKIANFFNPNILALNSENSNNNDSKAIDSTQYREYSSENVFAARFGQMLWTILFFIVFARFLPEFFRVLGITDNKKASLFFFLPYLLIISLPQLLFLQSYVNLDNMGIFASFYHLWAILAGSPIHLGISFFLLLNSKLNFICIFAMTILFLIYLQRQKELTSKWLKPLLMASGGALWWSLILPTFQKMGLKSILGFQLLPELFKNSPLSYAKTTLLNFTQITFVSSYGLFGWMTQYMPKIYYMAFTLWMVLGMLALIRRLKNTKINGDLNDNQKYRFFLWSFLALILTNIALHFIAGFGHSYQPQGRYLLPSTILIYCFGISLLVSRISKNRFIKFLTTTLLLIFSIGELSAAIISASKDPFQMGFGYGTYQLKQDLSHEKTQELLTGDEVVQSFNLDAPIEKIYIRTTSFHRVNRTTANILLTDCSDKIFYKNQISFQELYDLADFKIIEFAKPTQFGAKLFCIHLKIDQGEKNKSIALLKSFPDTTHLGKLTINGQTLGGDLVIKVY
jgi:hypothetical protein